MAVLQYSPNLQDGVLFAFWTVLKISPLQFPKPFPISNCFRIRLKLMITQDIVHKKILNCYFYFMSSKCYTQSLWLWHDIKFQLVIEVLQQCLAIFLLRYCYICWIFCRIAEFTTPQYPPLYVVHHWYLGSIPRSKRKK